jgi:hypothetical protein
MTNALARKLLATFTSIDTTVDIFIHERVGLKVNNHTLFPPLAYELSASTGGFPSLIRAKRIRAHYLRQTRPDDAEAIEAAERLAAQQITRIEPREILCVGHPRCGSRYMAELLSAFGLDVGHERLGAHGISSWMFAVDDDRYPFAANPGAATRRDKHFAAIIHHVRDPAAAIPSIIVENQYSAASYEFRRKHIRQGLGFDLDTLADPVERAVVAYLSWNRLVDAMKPHLVARIEDGEETVRRFLVERGLVAADFRPGRMPPKDANTRKPYKGQVVAKPVLPPSAWSGLTPETRRELRQFCRTHGYPDPA